MLRLKQKILVPIRILQACLGEAYQSNTQLRPVERKNAIHNEVHGNLLRRWQIVLKVISGKITVSLNLLLKPQFKVYLRVQNAAVRTWFAAF